MIRVHDFLSDQRILRSDAAPVAPIVSVILPTYRRCATLQRAMDSVLTQTFAHFELIVVDDGSTDGSSNLIEQFRAHDPRVVHVRHERNCGLPALRVNEGIELARGKYLAFQFDDDTWHPNALHALTTAAEEHPDAIIVGTVRMHTRDGQEAQLPGDRVNLPRLYAQNRIANNSVLFPRVLVDHYGMYDCHIGMRRLCDWDLWLRYIKHVPLVILDQIIGQVTEGSAGAIGVTAPWDLALFRYLHAIPRDTLLTPAQWRQYQVDALRIGDVEIKNDLRRRLYEEHLVPYYLRFRHACPAIEGFSATLPDSCKIVLHTHGAYDVSDDIGLNQYDQLANQRGTYKAYFQPVDQVKPEWGNDTDALLLIRTIEEEALLLRDQALSDQIPMGFYLDDDVLTFHEYGASFSYLAPGTPGYSNLLELVRSADAVWVTSSFIKQSVQSYNPRVIPHSGCVPAAYLPASLRSRAPHKPLRIGYVGTNYRREEFETLVWPALQQVSVEFGERLHFEFWGLDVQGLVPLDSPVVQRPFTFSYWKYLKDLKEAEFDILLSPLLDFPRPRLGKSVSKYFQTAVAGALGIFSDVPQYASLPGGLTCLKATNRVEAWYEVLRQAITMPLEQFDEMRQRMIEHVREEFTEVAQIHLHEAAWRATEFHAKTRRVRYADGRPRVMYVFHSAMLGGGETQLWRRLRLARDYGIEPIAVLPQSTEGTLAAQSLQESLKREQLQLEFAPYTCFTEPRSPREFYSEVEREEVRQLLRRCQPAVVHTVTFVPTFGQMCSELQIPHVASLYAIEDHWRGEQGAVSFKHCALVQSDSIRYARRWRALLGVEGMCSREVVPEQVFALGTRRRLTNLRAETKVGCPARLVMLGTLQERKQQFEAIQAIGRLVREGYDCELRLFGYTHFFPAYVEKCHRQVRLERLQERVTFCGFSDDVIATLEGAKVLLSLSTVESFPSAIKEAMAAGVLVVATPVGGIPELIIDGVSGILCTDTSVEAIVEGIRRALCLAPAERQRIVEQARRVARSEFHPQRIASDLMLMYNRAIDLTQQSSSQGVIQTSASSRERSYVVEPGGMPTSTWPLGRSLTYTLVPHRANWFGIDVLIGTHQRQVSGVLYLQVWSSDGRLLRQAEADLSRVHDNTWLRFRFEPLFDITEQPLWLKFRRINADGQTLISLYETAVPLPKLKRWFNRLRYQLGLGAPRDSLYCRMWYAP